MCARTLCLVLLLLLSGCASGPKPALVDNAPLTPGDCVAIIFDLDSADLADLRLKFYMLDSSGDVSFPVISKIHLAGLTLEQARQRIKDACVPKYFREVDVSVRRCR